MTITPTAVDLSTSDRDVDDMVAVSRRVSLSTGLPSIVSGEKTLRPVVLSEVHALSQSHEPSPSPHDTKLSTIFDNENVV